MRFQTTDTSATCASVEAFQAIARGALTSATIEADATGARLHLRAAHDTALIPIPGSVEREGSASLSAEDAFRLLLPGRANTLRIGCYGNAVTTTLVQPGAWTVVESARKLEAATAEPTTDAAPVAAPVAAEAAPEVEAAVKPEAAVEPEGAAQAEAAVEPEAAVHPEAVVVDGLALKRAIATAHRPGRLLSDLDVYRVEFSGETLSISGSDADIVVSESVAIQGDAANAAWSAVIGPRSVLRTFAKSLRKGTRVTVSRTEDGVTFATSVAQATVLEHPDAVCPVHPSFGADAEKFASEKLADALVTAAPWTPRVIEYSSIDNIRIEGSDLVATDGRRMVHATLDVELPTMHVPAALGKLLAGQGTVSGTKEGAVATFEAGARKVSVLRLDDRPYPAWKKVIENVAAGERVHLSLSEDAKTAIAQALKTLPMRKPGYAISVVANGALNLAAKGEGGEVIAKAELPYALNEHGSEVEFRVNGRFFADLLALPGNEVSIPVHAGNAKDALAVAGAEFDAVVMPLC